MQKYLNPKVIGWKVSTLNFKIASLRYRALLPILALERYGIKNRIFQQSSRIYLDKLDALVIVKSFTWEDLNLAQKAVDAKVPVIFDLCDNIFISQYSSKNSKSLSPADFFLLIANYASAIVVTTEPLAKIVREKIENRIPVYVVPDGIETTLLLKAAKNRLWLPQLNEYFYRLINTNAIAKLLRQSSGMQSLFKTSFLDGISRRVLKNAIKFTRSLLNDSVKLRSYSRRYLTWRFWVKLAYRHYDKFRAYITGSSPKLSSNIKSIPFGKSEKSKFQAISSLIESPFLRQILWFGSHGASHADFGMLDLLYIRKPLEKLATEFNLELVVISNNLDKFNKYILPMAIPSRYIKWSSDSMAEHLQNADVVVIPNSLDAFSICKSANRATLALAHGVPVVATSTPALKKLRGCIGLDDFEGNLRRYLENVECAKSDVQQGQKVIDLLYSQKAIGRIWSDIINKIINRPAKQDTLHQPELIIAIHLPQDIDFIRPLLDEAFHQGIHYNVWTSISAMQRWPDLKDSILNMGFNFRILQDNLSGFDTTIFPDSASALLTISETNLAPHKFTHHLTKLANSAGLFTATIQHGFENVGLTYSDEVHDINSIRFASQKIFIWGSREQLHPNITPANKKKCLPVGCPKLNVIKSVNHRDSLANAYLAIGIFENLHWHRYSDEYREFFLKSICSLAKSFPNINFLIKPHIAGMWLTTRYLGELPKINNLIIVDPNDPQWEGTTASELFGSLIATITSPSTIALDAARANIPVAIVAHELDLENYEPLPLIYNIEDLHAFVSDVLDTNRSQMLQKNSQKFLDRVLIPGNAARQIFSYIESYKKNRITKNAA
jgi:hypothetical protein